MPARLALAPPGLRPTLRTVAALLAVLVAAGAARAQAPLFLVDEQTQVRNVFFRYVDTRTFDPPRLREQIATTAPGFLDRGVVGRIRQTLPLLGEPGAYPFVPIELQRDVVRLRRFYERNGFPEASVDYLVRLDTSDNRVNVLFVIEEGPELLISEVRILQEGQLVVETIPEDLREEWIRFRRGVDLRAGERLDEFSLTALQSQVGAWFRERGYPFVNVGAERFIDETGLRASVQLKVDPGPRARYGAITIEGAESVRDRVVERELPFRTGDPFRASELSEGRREIFGLNLFQLALVDVAPDQAPDSTVDIRVRVREGPRRVVNAYTGYFDRGGLTGRIQFTHRNFLGDARTFIAAAEARTGLLGTVRVGGLPLTDYSGSLTLRQPYVFHRQLSAGATVLARQRNDEIERSDQAEFSTTLLLERAPLQTAALTASANYRVLRLDEGRSFSLLDPETLGLASLGATTGALDAAITFGLVDNPLQPRQGFILRPGARLSTGLISDFPYARLRGTATGFLPFGQTGSVVARVTGGFIAPFAPTQPDSLRDYLLLRDQLFFAGGTTDVRGWAETQLGPKLFDVFFPRDPDEPDGFGDPVPRGFFGIGGRGKLSFSLQANLPLPFAERFGANVFLDGGRVFAPSRAYTDVLTEGPGFETFRDVLEREGGYRFGTGAGVQYLTPVGFINVALGYKLNPSFLDVRRDDDLIDIYLRSVNFEPIDLESYPASFLRRFQLHFSIGQNF